MMTRREAIADKKRQIKLLIRGIKHGEKKLTQLHKEIKRKNLTKKEKDKILHLMLLESLWVFNLITQVYVARAIPIQPKRFKGVVARINK